MFIFFSLKETVHRFGRLIRWALTLKSAAAGRRLHSGSVATHGSLDRSHNGLDFRRDLAWTFERLLV